METGQGEGLLWGQGPTARTAQVGKAILAMDIQPPREIKACVPGEPEASEHVASSPAHLRTTVQSGCAGSPITYPDSSLTT